jgi:hypothetical protein
MQPAKSLMEIALDQSGIDLQSQKFQELEDGDTLLSGSEFDLTLANTESFAIPNEENDESIELNFNSLSLSDCQVNEWSQPAKNHLVHRTNLLELLPWLMIFVTGTMIVLLRQVVLFEGGRG